jgi:hypothetical protein
VDDHKDAKIAGVVLELAERGDEWLLDVILNLANRVIELEHAVGVYRGAFEVWNGNTLIMIDPDIEGGNRCYMTVNIRRSDAAAD